MYIRAQLHINAKMWSLQQTQTISPAMNRGSAGKTTLTL